MGSRSANLGNPRRPSLTVEFPERISIPRAAVTQTKQSNSSARRIINHPAVLQSHRRLGVTAALAVILSSLSGMLHPIMTRMQPEPAKLSLENRIPSLEHAMPIGRVLGDRKIANLSDVRIVTWDGKSYSQISLPARHNVNIMISPTARC